MRSSSRTTCCQLSRKQSRRNLQMQTPLRALCALAFLALAPELHAAPVTVVWTPPTQYVDNTPIASGDIASTTVEYGSCNGTAFGTKAGQVVETGAAATMTVATLGPGTYCFRAFVTTIA